jgi:hypothetical protein
LLCSSAALFEPAEIAVKTSDSFMKTINALILLCCLGLAGCSTRYQEYVGGSVMCGKGGSRRVINGIDFWENGEPPFPYRIIGIIDDGRPGGPPAMAGRDGAVARKAKKYGGDGTIKLGDSRENLGSTGMYSAPNAIGVGSATSLAIVRREGKYAVIKYVLKPQ